MATLVIETATAACSVALIEEGRIDASIHEVVGRGHAERLVPMVAELLGGRVPTSILVDCGPGSFTGIRVGIAAARGLATGWSIPVLGYSSLAIVAADAFETLAQRSSLAVVLEGGHGEVFMQAFAASPFTATGPLASLRPSAALELADGGTVVGSGVHHLLALDPGYDAVEALPRAEAAALLPVAYRTLAPRPIYGRGADATPVAQPTRP